MLREAEAHEDDGPAFERVKLPPKRALPKFRLMSIQDIYEMPDPEWLIEGILQSGTFAELFGQDKSGKSFLALDWALCSALGRDWLGRKVKPGPVVYVAAEGAAGLKFRVRAWLKERSIDPTELAKAPIRFITRGVDMLNGDEVDLLITW